MKPGRLVKFDSQLCPNCKDIDRSLENHSRLDDFCPLCKQKWEKYTKILYCDRCRITQEYELPKTCEICDGNNLQILCYESEIQFDEEFRALLLQKSASHLEKPLKGKAKQTRFHNRYFRISHLKSNIDDVLRTFCEQPWSIRILTTIAYAILVGIGLGVLIIFSLTFALSAFKAFQIDATYQSFILLGVIILSKLSIYLGLIPLMWVLDINFEADHEEGLRKISRVMLSILYVASTVLTMWVLYITL